ncbi:3-hydroxy-9,10-secoandrosta-1,3,5(10)-triene-9,17-dione monooxygenase oxygenase subunit [Saccharopolyspora sp. CA-218241]|uniref:3-hydroxy-9,10-secoandrosta-1,3,5(10)-triene-9, 17-dione monooxygenase oxygenase subunit n=1 Tax=Saccharopolyspora sp. CA-218241 TaxID=3240027 RepID=UPI003D953813
MEQLREAVRALLPRIAERAAVTDETSRVPVETVRELREAGFFRALRPRRYGGLEGDPVEFFRAVRSIAGACTSTGWLGAVLGVHPWQVALFDRRAQDEVWGEDPEALLSSAYAPVGALVPVDGGYALSGRWSFSSGCEHASWALLGAVVAGADGRPVDFLTVLVPRSEYAIEDVWDVVGLRGTASNDIVVERAVVPAHRVIRNYAQARLRCPGHRVNRGPLYRLPFGAVFTAAITAPILGAAEGCLRTYVETARDRTRLSLGGGRFAEDPFAHAAVARAASQIDAAVLQLERNLAELLDCAHRGEDPPRELRLRARRDQVHGTERALEAVDRLFAMAGGRALRRGDPIERAWRDVHAGGMHAANDVERTLALYGRGAFGFDVEDNLV